MDSHFPTSEFGQALYICYSSQVLTEQISKHLVLKMLHCAVQYILVSHLCYT